MKTPGGYKPARREWNLPVRGLLHLVRVSAQNFAVGPGANGHPGLHVDGILDEADGAISHQDIDTASMVARGI